MTVVAPARAERPGAARGQVEPPTAEELDGCPFCAGREDRTPPETLRLGDPWQVRVVPNLFPAFERQEVVVHAPRHARSLGELGDDEVRLVAQAWAERFRAACDEGFEYVHALVNEGREAGASLLHSHSQLVWLRECPPEPRGESWGEECRFCSYLAWERSESRVVAERDGLVLLCPWASRSRYEMLVAPAEHARGAFRDDRLGDALVLAVEGVRRLTAVEGPRPLNLWVHDVAHWHIEVLPRLSVPAGIELGAGIYVNSLDPDEAARRLREAAASRGCVSEG